MREISISLHIYIVKPINHMSYDIIIIGSGIAGLYAAYKIHTFSPDAKYLILEKNKKRQIGGRANTESFYGEDISIGAGIGRKKDILLKSLVIELGFDVHEFKTIPQYSSLMEPVDILKILKHLREEYNHRNTDESTTFERFAKPILGEQMYKRLILSSGYTDYEREDAYETLYNYGMEDNACCLKGFGVNWHNMVSRLASKIGESNIKFSNKVIRITRMRDFSQLYSLETENGMIYQCKKVIVATTIESLRSIFPRHPIYKQIEGQPFLRIYGKFSKQSIPIMKEYVKAYTCVPGPIQKMIPMNPDDGIYMIVYNDNKHTLQLKDRIENTPSNREFYCKLIERSLGIPSNKELHLIGIRSFYWNIGTHYYKPLDITKHKTRKEFIKDAQNPEENILVVGEVVSIHQGWVEGALESVNSVVTKKWCKN